MEGTKYFAEDEMRKKVEYTKPEVQENVNHNYHKRAPEQQAKLFHLNNNHKSFGDGEFTLKNTWENKVMGGLNFDETKRLRQLIRAEKDKYVHRVDTNLTREMLTNENLMMSKEDN
jgi:hypothetical protein